jgi:hypothetical protein
MIARTSLGAIAFFTLSVLISSCSELISTQADSDLGSNEQAAAQPESALASPDGAVETPESSICSNDVEFIEDLTVPDGSVFPPGSSIDKRWSVRNRGSCNWTSNYRLVRLDQDVIQSPAEVALYPARAGALGIWQVDLIAPMEPGEYMARWQAREPSGEFFGQEVFVIIQVEVSTAQPSETPTLRPTDDS